MLETINERMTKYGFSSLNALKIFILSIFYKWNMDLYFSINYYIIQN
jgi:hypothetical protein